MAEIQICNAAASEAYNRFIVITSLISYFQTYIPVMVLTGGGPGTQTYLASYLIYQEAFSKYNFGYASALSFVLFILLRY